MRGATDRRGRGPAANGPPARTPQVEPGVNSLPDAVKPRPASRGQYSLAGRARRAGLSHAWRQFPARCGQTSPGIAWPVFVGRSRPASRVEPPERRFRIRRPRRAAGTEQPSGPAGPAVPACPPAPRTAVPNPPAPPCRRHRTTLRPRRPRRPRLPAGPIRAGTSVTGPASTDYQDSQSSALGISDATTRDHNTCRNLGDRPGEHRLSG